MTSQKTERKKLIEPIAEVWEGHYKSRLPTVKHKHRELSRENIW